MTELVGIRTGTTKRTYNWPSREEWAHCRQHPYWDSETGCPFADKYSHRFSGYATPDEIAAAITALEGLWRQHGRRMRELKAKGSPLYRQPQEDESAYLHRVFAMSIAEMAIANEPDEMKRWRHYIKKWLIDLRADRFPFVRNCDGGEAAVAILQPITQRYESARDAAEAAWKQETLLTPIDDAAWEAELEWRRQCDGRDADDAGHPERFYHKV
jgi:hypothetical protein